MGPAPAIEQQPQESCLEDHSALAAGPAFGLQSPSDDFDEGRRAMPKEVLRPKNLSFQPRPTYPYSPGAKAGGWIFTAGQVAWDEKAALVGRGDVRAQTRQVLANIRSILAEGGAAMTDVLKCNVYLVDLGHFQVMNEEFARAFPRDPPARTTVQAALADPEMLIEIEAVAFIGGT
jgi:reactive intermediate/imine deaminase